MLAGFLVAVIFLAVLAIYLRKRALEFRKYREEVAWTVSAGRQITNFPNEAIDSFVYSPDGKSILMARSHLESDAVVLRDTAAPSE